MTPPLSMGDLPGLLQLLATMANLEAVATGKGENKSQSPMLFLTANPEDPLALHKFEQVQGTAVMGFVNWTDVSRLLATMTQAVANFAHNFRQVPILAFGGKHGNACGGAVDFLNDSEAKARVLQRMLDGDKIAIFGGFILVNFEIDTACAETIIRYGMSGRKGQKRRLIEGVVAPSFTEEAKQVLADRRGRCKLLVNPALASLTEESRDNTVRMVQVRGGWLAQHAPTYIPKLTRQEPVKYVVGRPTEQQITDLLLADAVSRTSNSNTITIAKGNMILANGVSQQSRIAAARLAIANGRRVKHDFKDAVAVSDSFFPFTDGIAALIKAGITAVLASSGADRDEDIIALCRMTHVTLLMCDDDIFRGFSCHIGM